MLYNRAVVEGWYVRTQRAPIPWEAWILPLALRGSFVLISYIMLGCLSVMLRVLLSTASCSPAFKWAARSRFLWFPFHPIGYLMHLTFPIKMFWFSIFFGWLCKVLITRFGSNDSYRKTIPAFLGLVLGDVTMILFWLVIDGWSGRTAHQLMPG